VLTRFENVKVPTYGYTNTKIHKKAA
jgi:hypothetical protein